MSKMKGPEGYREMLISTSSNTFLIQLGPGWLKDHGQILPKNTSNLRFVAEFDPAKKFPSTKKLGQTWVLKQNPFQFSLKKPWGRLLHPSR